MAINERWVIGDLRDGRIIADVPPVAGSRATDSLGGGSISLQLETSSRAMLRLLEAVEPWRHYLAVLHDGVPAVAGPIINPVEWTAGSDGGAPIMTLTSSDLYEWAKRRILVSPSLADKDHGQAGVVDFIGSYPRIARGAVEMIQRRGWSMPPIQIPTPADWHTDYRAVVAQISERRRIQNLEVQREEDRPPIPEVKPPAGVHWLEIEQTDLVPLAELFDRMPVDIRFTPFAASSVSIAWRLDVGTDAQSEVRGDGIVRWDCTRPGAPAAITRVTKDGSMMTRRQFTTGGRSDDQLVITEQRSQASLDDGDILLERVDSGNSDESVATVLAERGWDWVNRNINPLVSVGVQLQADSFPRLSTYRAGDVCELIVKDTPMLADGLYRARILSRSWQAGGDVVDVEITPPEKV